MVEGDYTASSPLRPLDTSPKYDNENLGDGFGDPLGGFGENWLIDARFKSP